jgi:small-conductance mechanosensitive channel
LVLRIIARKNKKLHIRFICNLLKSVDLIACAFAVLGMCVDLDKLAAPTLTGGGLVLAILSFAAQKVLNNILSGISISLSRPFNLGDKIKVLSGSSIIAEGTVSDITLRHTVIMTYDGQACIVPNGTMNESLLINVSSDNRVGNFLEITVGYGDDLDLAIKILKDIVLSTENVLDCTTPLVSRFDADGPVIKTTVWTATVSDNFIACGSIRKRLIYEYRAQGITIPYKTITIDK